MIQSTLAAILALALFGNPSDPTPATLSAPVAFQGTVLDQGNAESLAGTTVRIEELGIEVICDFDGNFSFAGVPAGTYTFHFSLVSYTEVDVDGVKIDQETVSKKFFIGSL